jgi:hypothetical protein
MRDASQKDAKGTKDVAHEPRECTRREQRRLGGYGTTCKRKKRLFQLSTSQYCG